MSNFLGRTITDPRALTLLGEGAYLGSDKAKAQAWWEQAAKMNPLGASLACWAGKKHGALGQRPIAISLLAECTVMVQHSKEAKEAQELLAKLGQPSS